MNSEEISSLEGMEEDEMLDDSDSTTVSDDDIEEQLLHLNEYDNDKQLRLLKKEIDHIVIHDLQPSEGWYDERFKHIYEYSGLGWRSLRQMFYDRDEYIYTMASNIIDGLTDLIESRYTKLNFSLQMYQKVIHDIEDIWNYYSQVYSKEDEEDADVLTLIDGIKKI